MQFTVVPVFLGSLIHSLEWSVVLLICNLCEIKISIFSAADDMDDLMYIAPSERTGIKKNGECLYSELSKEPGHRCSALVTAWLWMPLLFAGVHHNLLGGLLRLDRHLLVLPPHSCYCLGGVVSTSGWIPGGPKFKSHARIASQSCSQLNPLTRITRITRIHP